MEKVELKTIAKQVRGVSYKPEDLGEKNNKGFVPLLRAGNIGTSTISNLDDIVFVSETNVREHQFLQSGDILIAASSGSIEIVGKSIYIEEAQGYTFGAFCKVLRPNKDVVNPKYVSFFFQTDYYRKKISNLAQGANINNLRNEHIDNLEIPLPDLETQNKIVAILDKAKVILDKREKSIALYDELLRATFLEMFGDVANNPKKLPKVPIKDFGDVITGNTPPRSEQSNYDSKFIEWIKTDNILSDSHLLSPAAEYLSETGFAKSRYVNENALLVTCIAGSIGSIGRSAISDRRVAFNQQINAIVPKSNVSVYFLYWMFKISADYIQSHATGGMKRLLTKGEFEKILFLKPNYGEQLKFEQIAVHYADFKLKLIQHKNYSENIMKSLSQQVFGERANIDVDTELEALINAIDLDKKDTENKIDTIVKDITFTQRLINRLEEQEFEDQTQYDKARYILFRIMREEEDLVKQVFKNNKVQLTLQNETA